MIAYVGLGSNLAHPRRQIARAIARLARLPRTRVVGISRNYLTAALDVDDAQPDYVNAVVALSTALSPRALLARLLAIERRHGRRRPRDSTRKLARSLDLDLLLYGRVRMRARSLELPHPRMHERAFALKPLADVAEAATIPGHGLARRLARGLRDQRIAVTRTHFIR